jgi:Cu-Zn family superoxide dismutase
LILAASAALALAACKTTQSAPPAAAVTPAENGLRASATLHDLAGRDVGTATFTDSYAGVIVSGTVRDLGRGEHAVHIHAVGKCEGPAFASAGGHFNPQGKQHGYENPQGPHLGDLPNIDTPGAGALHFEFLMPGVTLTGTNALLDSDGAAIVIHAGHDDYKSDPAGNAGGRIACGVITRTS